MPNYEHLDCITSLVDIRDSCATQTDVQFFLDDLGLSLAEVGKVADERYITGRNLVDQKKRIALDDVYTYLTYNVTPDCDLDKADGILCDKASQIARAVWYRVAALIYKEIAVDSNRYNEVIQFAGTEALSQMLYYDNSLTIFTSVQNPPAGMYQRELDKLEPIRGYIEQTCCVQCRGGGWRISLP